MLSQTCPSDCFATRRYGNCTFIDVNTGQTLHSCLLGDVTCVGVCVWSEGRYGTRCDMSLSELQADDTFRVLLLDSLAALVGSSVQPSHATIDTWSMTLALPP